MSVDKVTGKKVTKRAGKGAGKKSKQAWSMRASTPWGIAFALLLVAIVATGLRTVSAAHDMRGLYGSLGDIQRETDSLLEDHSRLMLERGALTSMQNIEEVAEAQLGMQFPDAVGQVLE